MLDTLFPRLCLICRSPGAALCLECLKRFPPAPDLSPPPGYERFGSLLCYEGPTRELVRAIKFRGNTAAAQLPAKVMARLVDWPTDVVTWAPTSSGRRAQRGFDQAELLARVVATQLGVPCHSLLARVDASGHQTGRNRAERLEGAHFTMSDTRPREVMSRSVLVVDDIRTTGATLCSAGDVLLGAGVERVTALTLAVTL